MALGRPERCGSLRHTTSRSEAQQSTIWLRSQACPLDEKTTCSSATSDGHLQTLKWARKESCPWYSTACLYAAINGHWEVLKWAASHGCPLDDWITSGELLFGNLDVLKWLQSQGCPPCKRKYPWDEKTNNVGSCQELAIGSFGMGKTPWLPVRRQSVSSSS